MVPAMRSVGSVFWALLLLACEAPRWGDGGMIAPGSVGVKGVSLRLDEAALATLSDELRSAIAAAGLDRLDTLGDTTIYPSLDLGAVSLELDAEGLVVAIAVAETTLAPREAWVEDENEAPCMPRLTVGPGTLRVPVSFTTDALGRLDASVPARAAWQGPLAPAPEDTCTSDDIQEALTTRLLDATAAHIASAIAPRVTASIGGRLPARFGAIAGPGSEAILRALPDLPVTRVDDGLAVHFSLHVLAETADCLAPLRLSAPPYPAAANDGDRDTDGRGSAGLLVPATAVQLLVDAFVLGGGTCGWSGALAGPFLSAGAEGEAMGWPAAWAAAVGSDGASGEPRTIVVDWQPDGLPVVTGGADGALAVDAGRATLHVYLRIEGAYLRVASVVARASLTLPLEVTPDGVLALGMVVADVEVEKVEGALLPSPEGRALGEALARSVVARLSGAALAPLPPGLEGSDAMVFESGDIALRPR